MFEIEAFAIIIFFFYTFNKADWIYTPLVRPISSFLQSPRTIGCYSNHSSFNRGFDIG